MIGGAERDILTARCIRSLTLNPLPMGEGKKEPGFFAICADSVEFQFLALPTNRGQWENFGSRCN
jgi:hypothetical protein